MLESDNAALSRIGPFLTPVNEKQLTSGCAYCADSLLSKGLDIKVAEIEVDDDVAAVVQRLSFGTTGAVFCPAAGYRRAYGSRRFVLSLAAGRLSGTWKGPFGSSEWPSSSLSPPQVDEYSNPMPYQSPGVAIWTETQGIDAPVDDNGTSFF